MDTSLTESETNIRYKDPLEALDPIADRERDEALIRKEVMLFLDQAEDWWLDSWRCVVNTMNLIGRRLHFT